MGDRSLFPSRAWLALIVLLVAYIVIELLEPVSGWTWFGFWCAVFLFVWWRVYRLMAWLLSDWDGDDES